MCIGGSCGGCDTPHHAIRCRTRGGGGRTLRLPPPRQSPLLFFLQLQATLTLCRIAACQHSRQVGSLLARDCHKDFHQRRSPMFNLQPLDVEPSGLASRNLSPDRSAVVARRSRGITQSGQLREVRLERDLRILDGRLAQLPEPRSSQRKGPPGWRASESESRFCLTTHGLFVRQCLQGYAREKPASCFMPLLDISVDLVQNEPWKADVNPLRLAIELGQINVNQCPNSPFVLFTCGQILNG